MLTRKHVAVALAGVAAFATGAIIARSPLPPVSVAPVAATAYVRGVLPDPVKTPGATNPNVTPATVPSTIGVHGWTATIRPPVSYTTALKRRQLADGYAVNGDVNLADYEEDHLVSLEDGGAPADERNLWPALWHLNSNGYDLGMKTKDTVENAASAIIKRDPSRLKEMQDGLAHDWPALYLKLVGPWPKWSGGTP